MDQKLHNHVPVTELQHRGETEKIMSDQSVTGGITPAAVTSQESRGQAPAPHGTDAPGRATVALLGRPGPSAADVKALAASASANPALVEFPADPWGFTRELRKVGLEAASRVKGQEDKQIVLLGTLMVLIAHTKARLEGDKAAHAERIAEVHTSFEEANKYNRQYGIELAAKAAE